MRRRGWPLILSLLLLPRALPLTTRALTGLLARALRRARSLLLSGALLLTAAAGWRALTLLLSLPARRAALLLRAAATGAGRSLLSA